MKIKKSNISGLLLFLIGFFCQTNQIMSNRIIIFYLLMCIVLFIIASPKNKFHLRKGFVWYFCFVLFSLFSMTYTINIINPDYIYIRIITYLLLSFLSIPLLEDEKEINDLFKGCLVGGLFGITMVLINQYNLIGVRRLGTGIYGSYAVFGTVCATTMASFIFLLKKYEGKKFIKLALFLYIAIALVLSGARKAILISIALPILMQIVDKRKKMSKKILILSVLLIFSLFAVYFSINNKYLYKIVGYRIESGISMILGEEGTDASLNERNEYKDLAKKMIKEKPLFGYGIHGFAYRNYVTNGTLVFSHDGFLEILSCYGIVGFIIYYWIFVYIFVNNKKLLYDENGIFLFSYIVIILLMELYGISFLNSYFIILVGLCANIINRRKNIDEKNY